MGAALVGKVLANWTHVSDRAFRVLVRMAVTALDTPKDGRPANVYFAGRELLAMSLRSDGGSEDSRFRTVARIVAELIKAGAIERADNGRTGHNAVYRLTLGEAKKAKQGDEQGGRFSHPQGGQISHPQGGQFGPERVADLATPRNQEEPIEELSEERRGSATTASHPSRVRTTDAEPASVIALFPGTANDPAEKPYRPVVGSLRWSSRSTDTIAEAAARVAARKAAHQARLAAGETTEVS